EMFEDKDWNLWIGTLGNGIDIFDRRSNQFLHHQLESGQILLNSDYISSIIQDRKGNIWMGTSSGLSVFDPGNHKHIFYRHTNDKNSLSHDNTICLLEDSQGRIW